MPMNQNSEIQENTASIRILPHDSMPSPARTRSTMLSTAGIVLSVRAPHVTTSSITPCTMSQSKPLPLPQASSTGEAKRMASSKWKANTSITVRLARPRHPSAQLGRKVAGLVLCKSLYMAGPKNICAQKESAETKKEDPTTASIVFEIAGVPLLIKAMMAETTVQTSASRLALRPSCRWKTAIWKPNVSARSPFDASKPLARRLSSIAAARMLFTTGIQARSPTSTKSVCPPSLQAAML
mmetsp:Transcript_2373/g.5631  ORF Transcript_2373/g.5631 Transcript_2373/m.5631 type:complete len:240 (-) Transcript_2373:630-1349(-)